MIPIQDLKGPERFRLSLVGLSVDECRQLQAIIRRTNEEPVSLRAMRERDGLVCDAIADAGTIMIDEIRWGYEDNRLSAEVRFSISAGPINEPMRCVDMLTGEVTTGPRPFTFMSRAELALLGAKPLVAGFDQAKSSEDFTVEAIYEGGRLVDQRIIDPGPSSFRPVTISTEDAVLMSAALPECVCKSLLNGHENGCPLKR